MDIETENVINLVFPNGIPGNIFLFFRKKHSICYNVFILFV